MQARDFRRFCDLVRALRRQHGLSQRALARLLAVSPGYIGQWELRLSQPSTEIAVKLCRIFAIADVEYVQRLTFAQRAPEWLRESIITAAAEPPDPLPLSTAEQRVVVALRRLPEAQAQQLAERIEGWVEAKLAAAET